MTQHKNTFRLELGQNMMLFWESKKYDINRLQSLPEEIMDEPGPKSTRYDMIIF